MTVPELKIIPSDLLPAYLDRIPAGLQAAFENLHDAELSTDTFSFYTSVSSVYSSKIEGEDIELDSYVKHKRFGMAFKPDYTKKTDDLYNAYTFAKTHELNEQNFAQAHQLLSSHLVAKNWQGKFRKQIMYVTTPGGRIEYVAAPPAVVESEMQKLFHDISVLINTKLSLEEVVFFASLVHLVFVKIHPWTDGNGRSARLLEKWFLARKLGEKAWFIQSEKMYYEHHQTYYHNIRLLGLEYESLEYKQALPFILMLPKSLMYNGANPTETPNPL